MKILLLYTPTSSLIFILILLGDRLILVHEHLQNHLPIQCNHTHKDIHLINLSSFALQSSE